MRLVVCPSCKTHLDVTDVEAASVACPCGVTVAAVGQGGDVCPECLARNPEMGRYCTGCGTEFLPQAPLASSSPKPCPACDQTLVSQRVREVWLLACSWCDGLWVSARSLDVLVRRVGERQPNDASGGLGKPANGAQRPFDGAAVHRRCPECCQRMVRKNFGRTCGVIVDWCRAHGTWFDADEIERVAAFIAAGGLTAPAPENGADEVCIVLEHAEHEVASPRN